MCVVHSTDKISPNPKLFDNFTVIKESVSKFVFLENSCYIYGMLYNTYTTLLKARGVIIIQ